MHKRRHTARDSCTISKGRNRNPTGHTATYCAFEGGPYKGNFHAAMIAARAAKRRKSVAAPTDETITQLHVSISSVDEDARNLECYQEEQRKDICQLYDTAASQMTTATEQGQTPRELQSTVTTQQQQIQTLMDTVQTLSDARKW